MVLVKRWYMETTEGEIIDGPFKKESELYRAFYLYIKQYKYVPVVVEREVDTKTFTQPEKRNERYS